MLGYRNGDDISISLATLMERQVNGEPVNAESAVLHNNEGIDLIPANIELSGMEMRLLSAMSREMVLRECLAEIKNRYDYILIDCMPSLSMIPINALAAADSVLIPVQPQYLSVKGMDQLLSTVSKVRKQINPELTIEGIVLTLTDMRTNLARQVKSAIHQQYSEKINIFEAEIPVAIRAAEASAAGRSILAYDPSCKVASAYKELAKEVTDHGCRIKIRDTGERIRGTIYDTRGT
jgi:chromosome partitioning protein